ncbi:ABC transporter ATP-binding protein [Thioalkalivibrio paradoxus]|uniref:ABC transporter n=1 Tax=Thioalkalivibrio paradoxus ARh 1 TaxID=713585 RepID=W0DQF4_9GAMM|nr:ATP-binding cassette domain-containing protein [Thioalkalivibrio paradoxus]AHE99208.1 ABC transporter [Thioalkalivibrio paradoxus ARh 1]
MRSAAQPPLALMQGAVKRRAQGESVFELAVPALHVGPGELVAVVGDSGCGKSTLLDMLALVMEPTRVERFEMQFDPETPATDVRALWASGAETRLAALRRDSLGYVLQTGGLLPFLSVADNIALPARVKGLPSPDRAAAELARRLGLDGCLRRMPDALSIGQRQRVAILRALLHGPRLVLADEPTAAVDKARAVAIFTDLQALARERGVAVVVVTHDVELIGAHADRTYGFRMEQVSEQETRSQCLEAA